METNRQSESFAACIQKAAFDCETVTIGGGIFESHELKPIAPLFAAAPDMLGALRALNELLDRDIFTDAPECESAIEDVHFALVNAQNAIAKAEGRS